MIQFFDMMMKKAHLSIEEFIQELPKAELHIHLEGAIEPETVLKLSKRHNMQDGLPANNVDDLKKWFTFKDFPHFLKIYLTIQDMLRAPEDFELIAYEMGADMAAQNILYREATFTPYTHLHHQDKGLTIEDILTGLEKGRQKARQEFGVEIRWVFDIGRNLSFPDGKYSPLNAEKTLEYALAGQDRGVVGFGLGGNEDGAPTEPFAHAFIAAKQAGFLSVPHAGETKGPQSVWGALNELQADRIGHGVRAIEDPELVEALVEKQITLEVNPTSNIALHIYENYQGHPFKILDDAGVNVTVNSDDPPLFNTTLSNEYLVLHKHFGYQRKDLIRIARRAFAAAGLAEPDRRKLLDIFDVLVGQIAQPGE
ncbi:MAG: adenosine deaminase [Chloroflexota bacterium]